MVYMAHACPLMKLTVALQGNCVHNGYDINSLL